MHLVRNTRPAGWWTGPRRVVVLSAISLLSLMLNGCYNGQVDLAQVGEINSFFDPTEVNIRPLHSAPLVKPILSTLDPAVEEPLDQYSDATDIQPDDLKQVEGDYRVGKNDLINVGIFDLLGQGTGETFKSVRVSERGFISLDFINPVYAEGMTELELQDAIRKAYSDAGQINNARVTVTVGEERARTFTIYGNVGGQAQYQILQNDFRILDALVMAHGPSQTEGVEYLYVVRHPEKEHHAPATEPSSPTDVQPSPTNPVAPTTELLEPPHTQGNPTGSTRLLDTNGSSISLTPSTQPGSATGSNLLAPDNSAPATGVVEGQPVALNNGTMPSASSRSATDQSSTNPSGFTGFKFKAADASDVRVIRVPVKELRNGHLQYNIVIHPGDLIFVPDPITGEFYMGGHIARSGPYTLDGRNITLKQAIVSAGMFDSAAIPGRSEIIRRVGPNKEVFIRLDLDKVWSGDQPDIYLKPYDIVQVGTNELAPFIAALRNAFRISYGFGFTYDINYAPNNGNILP